MSDWNAKIIEEFRANQGRVGGNFQRATLLLLHHTGARSGVRRINPLMYQSLGDGRFAVFASKGGAPTNPAWFHNLKARPDAMVEIGTGSIQVVAREALGEERERIWSRQKVDHPEFVEYERKTERQIPVVILEPFVQDA